jgi:hypothetical protein
MTEIFIKRFNYIKDLLPASPKGKNNIIRVKVNSLMENLSLDNYKSYKENFGQVRYHILNPIIDKLNENGKWKIKLIREIRKKGENKISELVFEIRWERRKSLGKVRD